MPLVMGIEHFNGQPVIGWRAYLDDDSAWDSDRHAWADVPDDGMQVLLTYHDGDTRIAWSGGDEYSLPGDGGGTKLGRLMLDEEFLALQLSAHADPWRPSGG